MSVFELSQLRHLIVREEAQVLLGHDVWPVLDVVDARMRWLMPCECPFFSTDWKGNLRWLLQMEASVFVVILPNPFRLVIVNLAAFFLKKLTMYIKEYNKIYFLHLHKT